MTAILQSLRMRYLHILALLALVSISACKKEDTTPHRGSSYLHIVGAAQNKGTFFVNFNYFTILS